MLSKLSRAIEKKSTLASGNSSPDASAPYHIASTQATASPNGAPTSAPTLASAPIRCRLYNDAIRAIPAAAAIGSRNILFTDSAAASVKFGRASDILPESHFTSAPLPYPSLLWAGCWPGGVARCCRRWRRCRDNLPSASWPSFSVGAPISGPLTCCTVGTSRAVVIPANADTRSRQVGGVLHDREPPKVFNWYRCRCVGHGRGGRGSCRWQRCGGRSIGRHGSGR